ncbi:OPT family oligopeptide transporter [Tenuibacillus multivorans]|uniref:Putative oligopeptide transporter, OPT family n=1 Tax=Tenuibacillus multivorans TaxID=237069 RepID=A0A1H0DI38_9BACI|nr:oligopeptide transporter, OPT family [Tenuibacillus multivorans]GEL76542.1 oligopeptide transporter, OPT family protein [Tenuibacillus multivorans]SDN69822.1 putative oligopeptide transporter, OPT family [Tenuibacillus multivorans]
MSKQDFKPDVPSNKKLPEFTGMAMFIGAILAIVFGAANAYLGLIVGMTVSASIPAAVISMAILRVILKRTSILENNIVQTITSTGESLAAGVIFTLPALFIWQLEPSLTTIAIIALAGGILGVVLMIPLRKALIVDEHDTLPYPEGTACAGVLRAGEKGGEGAKYVFKGLGIGAIFKFLTDAVKAFPASVEWEIYRFKNAAIGMDTLPALLGVGYIIGPRIAGVMFGGAVLGWLGIIPLISYIGEFTDTPIYPGETPIAEMDYWAIWDYYIRYIGAGAVAFGGVIGLVKTLPTIWSSFRGALKGFGADSGMEDLRTERELPMSVIVVLTLAFLGILMFYPTIDLGIIGSILLFIFGFFFVTVSSRIVGIIGSSSNPVSGMTIAALIFIALVLTAVGQTGEAGMVTAITIGAVVCIAAAIAGDTSQDLKTGFLIGATPRWQQIAQLYGVLLTSVIIGFILILLDNAYGFGSSELPAPQAVLMSMVVEGIMSGDLPWNLIFIGMAAALMVELFGIGSLPFAVGLYLPIHLSAPIMFGGLIRAAVSRRTKDKELLERKNEQGILLASGYIAGEALMGVIVAIAVTAGVAFPESPFFGPLLSIVAILAVAWYLYYTANKVR